MNCFYIALIIFIPLNFPFANFGNRWLNMWSITLYDFGTASFEYSSIKCASHLNLLLIVCSKFGIPTLSKFQMQILKRIRFQTFLRCLYLTMPPVLVPSWDSQPLFGTFMINLLRVDEHVNIVETVFVWFCFDTNFFYEITF